VTAEKKRMEEKTDFMKTVRMPWFCPKCEGLMNKRLDEKMWRLHGTCFDCVVVKETQMRIDGTYEEYAYDKTEKNRLDYFKDVKQLLEENLRNLKNPEFISSSFGETEKWSGVNLDKVRKDIKKDLKKVNELIEGIQNDGSEKGGAKAKDSK